MIWVTEIKAIKPSTGDLITYCGPEVPGITLQDAQAYCETNGLGYCNVIGSLVAEIPCKEGTYEPDFKNMVDYENNKREWGNIAVRALCFVLLVVTLIAWALLSKVEAQAITAAPPLTLNPVVTYGKVPYTKAFRLPITMYIDFPDPPAPPPPVHDTIKVLTPVPYPVALYRDTIARFATNPATSFVYVNGGKFTGEYPVEAGKEYYFENCIFIPATTGGVNVKAATKQIKFRNCTGQVYAVGMASTQAVTIVLDGAMNKTPISVKSLTNVIIKTADSAPLIGLWGATYKLVSMTTPGTYRN